MKNLLFNFIYNRLFIFNVKNMKRDIIIQYIIKLLFIMNLYIIFNYLCRYIIE
jgi:putative flippase GtrA